MKLRRVLGTAGHIDHGKTSLVGALTGVDTDRLPEEKARGITIELGFAAWPLGAVGDDELVASIVDVPGHERFVRTMAAGAGGMDAVLLVVAADDGVMPQTREHLAICTLLGVERGVCAITKADTVDEEMLELVTEEVRELTAGTFLDGAPIVATSAKTGAGLPELTDAVRDALAPPTARALGGPAILPVDRVLQQAGFGTVVTGTLLAGRLEEGAKVEVIPGPRAGAPLACSVRGLQVHGESVGDIGPGTRLAINLRGVDAGDIHRGALIVSEGALSPTTTLLVELSVLDDANAIKKDATLSLQLGTADAAVRVEPLGDNVLEPGTSAAARLRSDRPLAAYAGQRFVLRRPGQHGRATLGGGHVLDPHPPVGKRALARALELAQALTSGEDAATRALALVASEGARGLSVEDLEHRLPPEASASSLADELVTSARAVRTEDGKLVASAALEALETTVLDIVADFHAQRPAMQAMALAELETRLPTGRAHLAAAAVRRLEAAGKVRQGQGAVALAEHSIPPEVTAERARILSGLEAGGLSPIDDGALESSATVPAPLFRDVLAELQREGAIVRLSPGQHVAKSALDGFADRVRSHFDDGNDSLATADVKDLAGGVSRKFAIPLLEWLDKTGVTRRDGDVRRRGVS